MRVPPENLSAFLAREAGRKAPEPPPAPPAVMPTPAQVLYTPPNSDGSRKACGNCYAYASGQRRCYIHGPSRDIAPDAVCGYHVFSQRVMEKFSPEFALPMDYVKPEQSGLERVPGGTSCDTCKEYAPAMADGSSDGFCRAVRDPNSESPEYPTQANVQAKGCCARWEKLLSGAPDSSLVPVGPHPLPLVRTKP